VGASGLSQFWSSAWYQSYIGETPAVYYPCLQVGGSTYGKAGYWIQHPRQWTWDASLRKTMGRHNMKAGLSMRKHKADGIYPNLMNFYFYQTYTAETYNSPDLTRYGSDWATFLLGSLDSNSYAQTQPYQRFRSNYFATFFQDDIRLTRNVTLNLGLRYEYETAPFDEDDRISRYLDLTNPIPELQGFSMPSTVTQYMKSAPTYNGAWVFADSEHRQLYSSQRFTLEPRAGIAIRLNDKTALRGGYARFVIPPVLIQNTLSSGVVPIYGYSAVTYVAHCRSPPATRSRSRSRRRWAATPTWAIRCTSTSRTSTRVSTTASISPSSASSPESSTSTPCSS
jgi:outer membrane receptor protein involved in Fe transport